MLRIIHPNRWLVWTLALVLIVAILVWWAIQLYSIEQDQLIIEATSPPHLPKPSTASSTSLDMSGWKTYRNEKYRFEFKYPDTFFVKESLYTKDSLAVITLDGQCNLRGCGNFLDVKVFLNNKLENNSDYQDFVRHKPLSPTECHDVLFGGVAAFICTINNGHTYFIQNQNNVFEIPQIFDTTTDRVLSTFKFLN